MEKYEMDVSKTAFVVFQQMEQNGFEVYLVGGCVRDSLVGRTPKDWDFTTNATPEEITDIFEASEYKVVPTGIKHGTVSVIVDSEVFEITTFRIDGNYCDGRHPETVEFASSIEEDLSRRDFTMNSIAYNPKKGFVDPFGGKEDIKNKVVRANGLATERFKEDALRMMRAIRFSSQLSFEIEKSTFEAIKSHSDLIDKISKERIVAELKKIFESNAHLGIKFLIETELLDKIMLRVDMEKLKKFSNFFKLSPADQNIRLAGIFFSMLEKEEDRTIVLGIASKTMEYLKYDNETKDNVMALLTYGDLSLETEREFKRIIATIGESKANMLLDFDEAIANYRGVDLKEINMKRTLAKRIFENNIPIKMSQLAINGNDLISLLGIKEGKIIGRVLNKLLNIVLENHLLNEKNILIDFAKKEIEC